MDPDFKRLGAQLQILQEAISRLRPVDSTARMMTLQGMQMIGQTMIGSEIPPVKQWRKVTIMTYDSARDQPRNYMIYIFTVKAGKLKAASLKTEHGTCECQCGEEKPLGMHLKFSLTMASGLERESEWFMGVLSEAE